MGHESTWDINNLEKGQSMVPKPPAFLGEEDSNLGPWAWTAMALTLITLWPWWGTTPLGGHTGAHHVYFFLSLCLVFVFFFFPRKKKQLKPQGVKARKRLPLPLRNRDRDRK